MNRVAGKAIRSIWWTLARYAGHAYVAGPELDDALRTCRRLSGLGFSSTLCFWDKDDSPEDIAEACTAALTAIAEESLDCYLSVKAPPLRYDGTLLDRVLERARRGNSLVHFDSHQPETADRTFAAIVQSARRYPRLGCTLPGCWQRSRADAELAIDLGLHVRVVKGQWRDLQRPDLDARMGYLDIINRLAGRASSVAVATHDPKLAHAAIERLQEAGTSCTLELLYGLPVNASLRVARALAVPVRVYVPYGYGWLPYSLEQARRKPRILWWLLRDLLSGGSPFRAKPARFATRPISGPSPGSS